MVYDVMAKTSHVIPKFPEMGTPRATSTEPPPLQKSAEGLQWKRWRNLDRLPLNSQQSLPIEMRDIYSNQLRHKTTRKMRGKRDRPNSFGGTTICWGYWIDLGELSAEVLPCDVYKLLQQLCAVCPLLT